MTENYVEHAAASGISSSNSREDSSSSSSSSSDDDVLTAFVSAIPSKGTKKEYLIRLRYFLKSSFHILLLVHT